MRPVEALWPVSESSCISADEDTLSRPKRNESPRGVLPFLQKPLYIGHRNPTGGLNEKDFAFVAQMGAKA